MEHLPPLHDTWSRAGVAEWERIRGCFRWSTYIFPRLLVLFGGDMGAFHAHPDKSMAP